MLRLARCALRPIQRFATGNLCSLQQSHYHSLFINPPKDEVPELTTGKLKEIFATDIGQAREYSEEGLRKTEQRRRALMELLPTPDDHLPPRKMADSFVTAIVPLRTHPEIRERYVMVEGNVRVGRLLEDMDVFAVFTCFKHIKNPKSEGHKNPYSVVTALVDSIHITNDKLKNTEDVRLSGHVSYVGKSSMEVCIVVDQKDDNGVYQKSFDAVFLMVARDPMNKGPARVNPLIADTPEEQEYMKRGAERQRIRRQQEEDNIFKKPPTEEERLIIHERFLERLKSGVIRPNSKLMKNSGLKSAMFCQPENRNRYNKIFGGFIMRKAMELARINTFIHAKRRPRIVNIDDIKFQLPVEIGSVLGFRSKIGYVEDDFVHVVVYAEIIDPKLEQIRTSNEFHFTFLVPREPGDEPVPDLEFETYEEAMYYLNSRRHFKDMMKSFGDSYLQNLKK